MIRRFFQNHKPLCITICIVISLVISGNFDRAAAQGASAQVNNQAQFVDITSEVVGLLSRIWIIPAKVAGTLMTNYYVYGSSFHLDTYLFRFWQLMRTFCLYALGFFFVFKILLLLFDPTAAKAKVGDLLKKTIIGGLLISASWGIIAGLVDLSVVMTSAVGAIPSYIYQNDRNKYQGCFSIPKDVTVQADKKVDTLLAGNQENQKTLERKDIVPSGDDASKPLMFFAGGVIQFFKMSFLPEANNLSSNGAEQSARWSPLVIISLVKALLLLMLFIPMVALMIVNMIRIFVLRLWIVFGPVLALARACDFKLDSANKLLDPKKILPLVFQPVAVIGMLSIGLILIIQLAAVLKTCSADQLPVNVQLNQEGASATIADTTHPDGVVGQASLVAAASSLGDFVGGVTGELLLTFFVMFLLRGLIKVGFSFSDITSSYADKIFGTAESMAKTVPFIPVGGQNIGRGAAQKAIDNKFGLPAGTERTESMQADRLNKFLGIDNDHYVNHQELQQLDEIAKKEDTDLAGLHKALWTKLYRENKAISAKDAQRLVTTWLTHANRTTLLQNTYANNLPTKGRNEDKIKEIFTNTTYKNQAVSLLNHLFQATETLPVNIVPTTVVEDNYGRPDR